MNNEQLAISKVKIDSKITCLTLLFSLCSLLFAQDGETRFIQRLTWVEDEYARRYEVIIENEVDGEYRGLIQEFTTALFIDVPLLPGKYRCRVITHDFLNRPGPVPEWKYIEVFDTFDLEPVHGTDDIELIHSELAQTTIGADSVRFTDKVDIFLSAEWTPLFTVSDGGSHFFKRDMALTGATVRFGMVLKESYFDINPGLELPVTYSFFNTGSGEQAHLLAFGINLSALKRFPGDKTAFTFRLGAGYGHLFTDDEDTVASFSGTQSIHINAGVSFLLFVIERQNNFRMYLETGLDYTHWFTSPTSYYLRPWVGIGFRK